MLIGCGRRAARLAGTKSARPWPPAAGGSSKALSGPASPPRASAGCELLAGVDWAEGGREPPTDGSRIVPGAIGMDVGPRCGEHAGEGWKSMLLMRCSSSDASLSPPKECAPRVGGGGIGWCCSGNDDGGLCSSWPLGSIGSGVAAAAMTLGSEVGKQRPSKSSVASRGHKHCARKRQFVTSKGEKQGDEERNGRLK